MIKVLIIGGGIGGLTAAVALGQRNIDATVYETAPALRPVGKGIWVPTNALTVFQRLGLAEARWIVNTARQHGRIAHYRNPLARTARNWLVKHLPEWLSRRQLDHVYSLNY